MQQNILSRILRSIITHLNRVGFKNKIKYSDFNVCFNLVHQTTREKTNNILRIVFWIEFKTCAILIFQSSNVRNFFSYSSSLVYPSQSIHVNELLAKLIFAGSDQIFSALLSPYLAFFLWMDS